MTPEAAGLLEAARAAGAREAEVFSKTARGRKVVLEPGLRPGAAPVQTVSDTEEEGMAIRLIDREGRRGFAWIGLPAPARAGISLLEAALASARRDATGAGAARPPLGPGPRRVEQRPELRVADPECMAMPAERIAALLLEAAAEGSGGSGAIAVDRLSLSEASTTIALANSRGFSDCYTKSLAFLSVALIPAEAGSAAVVEERSACRLADLDARDCVREALQRASPARRSVEPASGRTAPLLLTPRASASFLAAVSPWALSGEPGVWKGSALRIVDDPTLAGRPGSAPFDGAGYETRRTVLVEDGAAGGRLSAEGGNLIRPSYRDLPQIGPAGLMILPEYGSDSGSPRSDDGSMDAAGDTLVLRVSAIEVVPGSDWRLRIRRADWWNAGTAIGPADGLLWEGSLSTLLQGASTAGTEVRFYHCGAPLGSPGLRLDGLGPLRVEAPAGSALRV